MYQPRRSRLFQAVILCGALSSSALLAHAQTPVPPKTPADNTKVNTRDRAKNAVTADQQKENVNDRTITQKIRQSVMGDKTLSSYAHNVKIVSQGGQVTLKGPVRSEDEKQNVEAKAVAVAGAEHVTNQITIAPAKPAKK